MFFHQQAIELGIELIMGKIVLTCPRQLVQGQFEGHVGDAVLFLGVQGKPVATAAADHA